MSKQPTPKPSTALEYAREVMKSSFQLFEEAKYDTLHYSKVAPGVNGALANLIAAEQAEREAQNA